MQVYGVKIIKLTEGDEAGGFLTKRIELINLMLKKYGSLVWTNQYS